MKNNELILKTLKKAGKALKGGEIATQSGLDKKLVDKAIKELQKNRSVFSPQRCYYAIK